MDVVYGKPRRWAVCLYRDPEETEQILTAVVIGLPGVASEGASKEEAISNVKEAINLRFEGENEVEVMKDLRHDYVIPVGGELIYVEQGEQDA
jgi:predicted RNase H-like HicB family nuclease